MNDELFLKQLEQIVPQEDCTRQIYAHVDTRQRPQTQVSCAQSAERTRHVVWELPAEPRFQVSRGGQKGDWKWLRPLLGNLTFLTLFILALGFWPHSRPRLASTITPAMPLSSSSIAPQTTVASNSYRPVMADRQTVMRRRTETSFAASSANTALQTRPSLYADSPVRNTTPARPPNPYSAGAYRVTSYRVAPAAPLTGSMPPMQSPY